MDAKLAALLYVGIIVPTIITVIVFIGFLVCLHRRSKLQKDCTPLTVRSATPHTPSFSGSYRSKKSAANEKFENSSQHSVDSAIDLADMELAADSSASAGIILSTLKLGKTTGQSQSKAGQQCKADVEVHYGLLSKGQYPSREQLQEEIHSQVKIYETALDAQKIALALAAEQTDNSTEVAASKKDLVVIAPQKQSSPIKTAIPRYTSTSKLVTKADRQPSNQLSKPTSTAANNYAFTSSWYERDEDSNNTANLYQSQYNSTSTTTSWRPNIAASCGSTVTDNYSSFESSRV